MTNDKYKIKSRIMDGNKKLKVEKKEVELNESNYQEILMACAELSLGKSRKSNKLDVNKISSRILLTSSTLAAMATVLFNSHEFGCLTLVLGSTTVTQTILSDFMTFSKMQKAEKFMQEIAYKAAVENWEYSSDSNVVNNVDNNLEIINVSKVKK